MAVLTRDEAIGQGPMSGDTALDALAYSGILTLSPSVPSGTCVTVLIEQVIKCSYNLGLTIIYVVVIDVGSSSLDYLCTYVCTLSRYG